MIHQVDPWVIHTLRSYRVYVLEAPFSSATVNSPSQTGFEQNQKSLSVTCRGASFVTHDYGSETFYPGEHPNGLWPCDYNIGISNNGKYCCVVDISKDTINLDYAISQTREFKAGQTVLLLDGRIVINGIAYTGIRQFDLTEDTNLITDSAMLAWTVI